MSRGVFINYWIGEEPNPPSPYLDQMPDYVNIVPLAFVSITDDYQLSFGFLTRNFTADQIKGWIKTVRSRGTKVLFSINDKKLGSIPQVFREAFIANVVKNVEDWGVDGIDFDYEPPAKSDTLVPLIRSLREALPKGSVFAAPIYSPWTRHRDLLKELAGAVDYITTMGYTPYPGPDSTINLCNQYAEIIGGWSKLVIGISCMGPFTGRNFTPLDDVKKLSEYLPESGAKGGAMLYTFSYDVKTRKNSGTGHPDGTWTETINEYLR